jgi:ferredoxin-NADP reductase
VLTNIRSKCQDGNIFAHQLMSLQTTYSTVQISAIREEAIGVKTFFLKPELPYLAGQFLTFVIHHHGKEERRSFSISSTPIADEQLSITVKRVDNGVYSRLLIDKAMVGDKLITTGAAGLFTLPANIEHYKQIFFFAAGIGITPIYSLLKTILYTSAHVHIVLVYSNRNRNETVFYSELIELTKKFKGRFLIEFLFSSDFDLLKARLNKELLPQLVRQHALVNPGDNLYYTCGPFSYMRMVILSLEEMGVPVDNIRKENFNTELKPIIKAIPPDIAPHKVVLRSQEKEYSFISQYPDTILQAARKNGINLPYSCETGRCGSCAVKCITGKIWMSNNEVLTDSDIANGNILTCVGYPVQGDIFILI